MIETLPANAGDVRNAGFIPGLGRSFVEGNGKPLRILGWRLLWTEEPGRTGSQRVGHD